MVVNGAVIVDFAYDFALERVAWESGSRFWKRDFGTPKEKLEGEKLKKQIICLTGVEAYLIWRALHLLSLNECLYNIKMASLMPMLIIKLVEFSSKLHHIG